MTYTRSAIILHTVTRDRGGYDPAVRSIRTVDLAPEEGGPSLLGAGPFFIQKPVTVECGRNIEL